MDSWRDYEMGKRIEDGVQPKLYTRKDNLGRDIYYFTDTLWFNNIEIITVSEFNTRSEEIEKSDDAYGLSVIKHLDDSQLIVGFQKKAAENNEEVEVLPNGYYFVGYSDQLGYYLTNDKIPTNDKYINIGGVTGEINGYIKNFYDKKELYEEEGLKHKRGILLYGPPGTGKSALITETIKNYVNDKVIIFLDDDIPTSLFKTLKYYQNDYVFIFEEFTEVLRDPRNMSKMLTFLDGEISLDNQLVIATTNYPESLPGNMVDRPGRFDDLVKIDNPNEEERRAYLSEFIEVDDNMIRKTKGFSIAYLRDLVINSKLNGIDIQEQIDKNDKRKKLVEKEFAEPKENKIGLY